MEEKSYRYFLRADLSAYLDEWVAIAGEEIIAHGKTFKETYEKTQREHRKAEPLFAKVPSKYAMML